MNIEGKRVLVAPLDWGIGHATRCVPIIQYLRERGIEVILAADGRPYDVLRHEFPGLKIIRLPGFEVSYPKNGSMAAHMLRSIPGILRGIREEHQALKHIVNKEKIDAVISDNRYGLWTKTVPCALITHQVFIRAPFGQATLRRLTRYFLSRFTTCWIPDDASDNNLSGELSHERRLPSNATFIGPLSRFSREDSVASEEDIDLLVILSGPEPQRTILCDKVMEQLISLTLEGHLDNQKVIVAGGCPEEKHLASKKIIEGVQLIPHLSALELEEKLRRSRLVISRPGYSTVMDLAAMGKKACFVPTPGQTEQEYLAQKMQEDGIAPYQSQKKFDLYSLLNSSKKFKGFGEYRFEGKLESAIDKFLSLLK